MQIKSSLYLLSPGPLKRHINVARIIYKAVFFTAAMVTKFKVKNPPFLLPLKLLQLKSQLIIVVLILLLFQSCNSPISHLLYSPETLNFFHSHNVFCTCYYLFTYFILPFIFVAILMLFSLLWVFRDLFALKKSFHISSPSRRLIISFM